MNVEPCGLVSKNVNDFENSHLLLRIKNTIGTAIISLFDYRHLACLLTRRAPQYFYLDFA